MVDNERNVVANKVPRVVLHDRVAELEEGLKYMADKLHENREQLHENREQLEKFREVMEMRVNCLEDEVGLTKKRR